MILQIRRNIAGHNTLCQSLSDRRLANAGFTDQYRVVLRLTGQDTDHVADLAVTANHRIQLILAGTLHQILTVFGKNIISFLRSLICHLGIAADRHAGRLKIFLINTESTPDLLHITIRLIQQCHNQMLNGYIFILHTIRLILSIHQCLIQCLGEILLHIAADLRQSGNYTIYTGEKISRIDRHTGKYLRNQSGLLRQQS